MKKLMLLFVSLFFASLLFGQDNYQGDLSFMNVSNDNTSISVVIECMSLPYEGLNRMADCNRPAYTDHYLLVGRKFRRIWTCNPVWDYDEWQIVKHNFNNIAPGPLFGLTHCSGNVNTNNGVWGYGKYKITITTSNNVTYICYLNNLDSYYYDEDYNNGSYRDDFVFYFNGDNATHPLELKGANNHHYAYIPAYTGGDIPELKVWEMFMNLSEPLGVTLGRYLESNTTPFGYLPGSSGELSRKYVSIGTGISILGVAPNDNTEYGMMWGYNTLQSYYTNPDLPQNENIQGSTVMTPSATMKDENGQDYTGVNFIVEPDCIFRLYPEMASNNTLSFWISSKDMESTTEGDVLNLKKNSKLMMGHQNYPNATIKIQTYKKGAFIDEGSIKYLRPGNLFKAWSASTMIFTGQNENHIINNGAKVEINGGATLMVGNNTTLTFDGTNSINSDKASLVLHSGANVVLGTNAKIIFTNGAYCEAENTIITASNSSTEWSGFEFDNSGKVIITNCTFNYAGVYLNFVSNNYNSTINITGNIFNNANLPLIIAGFGGSYFTNSLVSYNTFNGNSSTCFIGRMFGGTIRNNNFSPSTPYNTTGIQLVQSSPYILQNTINSSNNNIFISSASYPHMAPTSSDALDQTYLTGGWNTLYSENADNINANEFFAYLDYGNNYFYRNNSSAYNLFGKIDLIQNPYNVRGNCWGGTNPPRTLLYYYVGGVIQYVTPVWEPGLNCNLFDFSYDDTQIADLGNGVYDTTYLRNIGSYNPPNDEEVYTQAYNFKINESYFDAIGTYKSLIDNYTSSNYLNSALYELYDCYSGLDTSFNQQTRYILFVNLKDYLEAKIASNSYSDAFNDIAYNLTLSCAVNMGETEVALEGYEFIALYHPDFYTRLMASWDYSETENYIGSGGSESEKIKNMTDEEYKIFRIKKLEKLIKPDPVLNKMKSIYQNKSSKHDEEIKNMLKANSESPEKINSKITEIKNREKFIESNVISNLRNLKTMSKRDRENKRISDLQLTVYSEISDIKKQNSNTPDKYNLSQNYPNPFNPVTKINYDLPKDCKINLVIYDMLGREIKTLVNEYKSAGRYTVEFNGSGFASGIYFYRIQAGDFVQVKRMVLVK